jgi:hypothetical protein
MRVCVFCAKLDSESLETQSWLTDSFPFLRAAKKEDIFFTSYRLPGSVPETGNAYFPWGQSRLRMTLCRGVLRLIDSAQWLPTWLAWIPLWLCEREFLEVILACDPDIVVLTGMRWRTQFSSIIRKAFPRMTVLTEAGQVFSEPCVRQECNPSAKVSIVLPTYNGARYLRQSIDSCLKQTFANLEVLVVDDASRDDTASIVQSYRDPRVRYFRHETNRGIAEGLNTGFRNATGDFLTWTSDDNYYAENAIEEMVRFLQTHTAVDFVYAENYIVNEGSTTWKGGAIRRNEPPESLVADNFIGACFLYTRKVYAAVGGYNPKTFLAEDYDYWVRVSRQFRMQRVFHRLYFYRFHENSLTSKNSTEEVSRKVKLVKELNSLSSH